MENYIPPCFSGYKIYTDEQRLLGTFLEKLLRAETLKEANIWMGNIKQFICCSTTMEYKTEIINKCRISYYSANDYRKLVVDTIEKNLRNVNIQNPEDKKILEEFIKVLKCV